MKFAFLGINGGRAGVWVVFVVVPMILVLLALGSTAVGTTAYKSAYLYFYEDEILAARLADINAQQIIEAKEAEDRKLRNQCEEMSLLAAVEARNIHDGSWEDGAAASSAVWQSPECIVFY